MGNLYANLFILNNIEEQENAVHDVRIRKEILMNPFMLSDRLVVEK